LVRGAYEELILLVLLPVRILLLVADPLEGADLPVGIALPKLLGGLLVAMAAVTVAASCVQLHPVMALPEGVEQEAMLEMVD
jgi:hypothetical protein